MNVAVKDFSEPDNGFAEVKITPSSVDRKTAIQTAKAEASKILGISEFEIGNPTLIEEVGDAWFIEFNFDKPRAHFN